MAQSPTRRPTRRPALWAVAVALALVAFVVAGRLQSAGLRWGLVETLHRLGMDDVALGAADLSLFQGTLVVRGISARAEKAAPFGLAGLLADFRWRPLLARRVAVETLELEGAALDIRHHRGQWVVNGLSLPVGGETSDGWSFDIKSLRLTASRLTVVDGDLRLGVDIDELTVENLRSWDAEASVAYRLAGRMNGAPITIEGVATPMGAAPTFAATVKVKDFDLGGLAAMTRQMGVDKPAGRIAADLRVAGGVDGVTAEGSLSAAKLALATADGTIDFRAADWTGSLRLPGDGTLAAEGRLEVSDMVGLLGKHRFDHARAGAKGRIAVLKAEAAAGIMPPLTGALDAWVEKLAVTEPGSGRTIAAAERVMARGIAFSPAEGAALAGITATGLSAKDDRVRLRHATAERVAMTASGDISVAEMALAGVAARLIRTSDGFEGFPAAEGEGGGPPPRVAIGRVKVTGGRVDFEDRTPSEPVRLALDGIELAVRNLDTGKPDLDSPFRLKAKLQGAQLSARGVLRPFAESLSGRLKGQVASLDLPPLSPYAADTLGIHLHTGQFDGELAVAVDNGALDGHMDLVLSKLFVAQADPKAPLAVKADMPVETVLDLLRDSEQRIRLAIPVRGNLSSPDFDVSDAVSQAVGGALKSTVLTTLKVAFPVVALIGFVVDEASTPRLSLQPLDFAVGVPELAPSHAERLAQVAELLRQRPGVKLNVCGTATIAADWPAMAERRRQDLLARLRAMVGRAAVPMEDTPDRDALAELAERRAQAVKGWLVRDAAIDPGRLFVCRPKVEDDGPPRVELLI